MICDFFLEEKYTTNHVLNCLLPYGEHKTAKKVPRNFPGVLEICPGDPTGKQSNLHKDDCGSGENRNEEFEYFFKHLLPRIDPPQTKYKI